MERKHVDQDRRRPHGHNPCRPRVDGRDTETATGARRGVYQPLTAGAIYLGGAADESVVIAADLIGFDLAYAAQAKQRIAAAAGMLPRQVILTATHTHCGPLFYPMMMPGEPELEYAEWLCGQLAAVAVAARGRRGAQAGSPFRGRAPGSGSTAGSRAAEKRCSPPIRTDPSTATSTPSGSRAKPVSCWRP